MKFRIRQLKLSYLSCDYANPSLNLKRQHKKICPSNLLSSFLPHSSLKGSQSKLTKSGRDLFSSCTHIVYIQKIALGESPRTNTFPPLPTFPPPHNFLSSLSLLPKGQGTGCEREWGRREGGSWGERRKRAAIKAIFAAYVSLSLTFLIHLFGGGWGGISETFGVYAF